MRTAPTSSTPSRITETHYGLGFAAWCDNNRVLIGNRAYMEKEGVPVPETEYEEEHSQHGTLRILYLAVSGNLHAMFVLRSTGGRNAARGLEVLQKENIRLLVTCKDPSLTARHITDAYHLPEGMIAPAGTGPVRRPERRPGAAGERRPLLYAAR